jgi:hypothetical protein
MLLARIDGAIEICKNHLKASGAMGTEIEAYLTRYLLVLICACFEEKIEELVTSRAEQTKDPAIASFIQSTVNQIFRSILTSEIAGLLGRFGNEHKLCFQSEMKKNPQAETCFNSIVSNRHDTAHKYGANISLFDLERFYVDGHIVLDAVKKALFGEN